MRNINEIFLAGVLRYPTFYAPGDKTKKGRILSYPMMSAQLQYPNVTYWSYQQQQEVTIPRQAIWVDVYPPKIQGRLDIEAGRRWKATVEAGHVYATLAGATFTTDKQNKGRIKVAFSNLVITNQRVESKPLNLVIVGGKARVTDAHRFTVEERYMNPLEKDPAKRWRSRYVPVASPRPLTSLHERAVLVFGALTSRDSAGNEYVHVLAEDVR